MRSQYPELELRIHFLTLILIKNSKNRVMLLPWTTVHPVSVVEQDGGPCPQGMMVRVTSFNVSRFIHPVKEQRRNASEKQFAFYPGDWVERLLRGGGVGG